MKKRIKKYQLNRDSSARLSLFKGLVASLIERETIRTTKAKAMAVRPIFERLLTKAKTGSVAARRHIHAYVQNDGLVKKMVGDIAPRFAEVHGGYTKITPYGNRPGDRAAMVTLALTKLSKVKVADKADKDKKVAKKAAPAAPKTTVAAPKETQVKTVKLAPSRAGKRGDR